ncbi:peptidoglycan DD-metalloendopeptidase family protein [Clostridium bovifaecis]|uniref:Peptidoglycan DD-metalloendopeptidase family protein n=1 Tax=Clostridium bovifaecis TaxID=2184719 RepID=A0A6I6F2S6_9CLOT|nr:peptidoglycan DD-metalloendopeptidase family protein [Clostridium bovifaecis]
MYMNGSGSYLDVLLSSESFSDLISRFYIISKISEFDNNLLNEIKESQKNIQKKKQSIELKQKELLSLKAELTVKQNELKKANIEKQSYYDSINEDLVNTEKILEKEVEESNRIKEEIRTVTEKNFSSDQDNSKKHSEDRIKQESRQESKQESRQEVKQKSKQESGKRAAILKTSDTGYSPVITSPFGMRFHPILKTYKMHTGIDYAAPNGTPIYAMSDGKVIVSRYSNSYGNYVVIDHGDGISTLYSHNSSNLVSVGESVKAGQAVAEMGETGYATGPHVHFEVRINGEPVNPEPYVIIGD